ncbi:hypothetical protein L7F22_042495 [Adiantum nelumboides]|nr:hypothetical protein [Adiantum nelumboides]
MGSPLFTLSMRNLAKKRRHRQHEGHREAALFVNRLPSTLHSPTSPSSQGRLPTEPTHTRPPTTPQGRAPTTSAEGSQVTTCTPQGEGSHPVRHHQPSHPQGSTIINFRGLLIDVTPSWHNAEGQAAGEQHEVLQELEQLPPVQANRTSTDKANNECQICLETLQASDIVPSVLPCNHAFHLQCITNWLSLNSSCPVCRQISASS